MGVGVGNGVAVAAGVGVGGGAVKRALPMRTKTIRIATATAARKMSAPRAISSRGLWRQSILISALAPALEPHPHQASDHDQERRWRSGGDDARLAATPIRDNLGARITPTVARVDKSQRPLYDTGHFRPNRSSWWQPARTRCGRHDSGGHKSLRGWQPETFRSRRV